MTAWVIVALGTLVGAAGMAVAVAATTVRRVDLYRWVAQRRPGAAAAGALLDAPLRVVRAAHGIASLGVLLTGLGMAALAVPPVSPGEVAAVVAVFVLALSLVYALPSTVGRRWPEPLIRRALPWVQRLAVVFAPVMPEPVESRRPARGESLRDEGEAAGAGEDELSVLSGVLAFAERPVREVMTPRTAIVAVREGGSLEETARLIAESGYSRIPVYRDSLDNIVGMIYAFDLLRLPPNAAAPVRSVAVAPASKRCADLLFEMQRQRRQFAVVLDEYGGTAGIATFEDLLEELVGEIFDEYHGRPASEGSMVELVEATGATPVEEIAARFGVALPQGVETVGGLLLRAAGRIPRTGERYLFGDLELDIVAATPNRVERVLIRRGPVPVVQLPPPEAGA